MAIEPMSRVSIAVPAHEGAELLSELRSLGCLHIAAESGSDGGSGAISRPEQVEIAVNIQELKFALEVIEGLSPEPASFFSKLASVPMMVGQEEIERALAETPLEVIYRDTARLYRGTTAARKRMDEIAWAHREFAAWTFLDTPLDRLQAGRWTRTAFTQVSSRRWPAVQDEINRRGSLVCEATMIGDAVCLCIACRKDDEPELLAVLGTFGLSEITFPDSGLTLRAYLAELEAERKSCLEVLAAAEKEGRALAGYRRELRMVLGYWESRMREVESRGHAYTGPWTHVVSGYARNRDVHRLEQMVAGRFPGGTLEVLTPERDEDVPVQLNLPRAVRPISFLVHMYGLPRYTDFDPSGFLMLSFYVFFGICFGDVGYGALLIGLSLYIARKNRGVEAMENFAMLFFYSGISTILFGILMGAWFGDLFQARYVGAGNPLVAMRESLFVFDPMAKPVVALVVALMIGMVNQLYGIGVKMYDSFRQHDLPGAVFDGLLWLITLPAMAVLISMLFVQLPGWLSTSSGIIFACGALGLVLTQGRGESTLVGKVAVGIISLYGIVGSYGCTAFIGDTLSYCRLLALGLTTGIVAMSINLMASMLGEVPYAGPVLAVLLLIAGHVFNFAISVLGAFIHSARLIFVEFFGRFYSGGGKPFQPLGIDSSWLKIRKSGTSAASSNP